MKRLNLYLESGNRAYVLHLTTDISEQKTINILRENSNARDELLRIGKDNLLVSYEGISHDIPIHVANIQVEKDLAKVILEQGEESKTDSFFTPDNENLIEVDSQNDHILFLNRSNTADKVETFKIVFSYGEYNGCVNITCSPANQIYDVVLDFGSEASQMLVHRRDSGINSEPIELFGNCLKHFYGIKSYGFNEYDQQDEDEKLFRSVFFEKTGNGKMQLTNNSTDVIVAPPSPDDPSVFFISKRDCLDKGARIPNIKLSYLADLHSQTLNIRDLHRALVMRFLHEAFQQIAKEEKRSLHKTFAVSVTLLIPNVMNQHEVCSFVKDIQSFLSSEPFHNNLPKDLNLSTIDVLTCSESDASLLNWVNKQRTIQPGRYLIIDIGKGTTDFSVVNVKSPKQAESVFRAGIIGAGNVLSYALLDNYLIHMGGIVGRKTLMEKVLHAEPALLYRIEQIIEKVKRGKTVSSDILSRVNVDEVSVEAIAEKIEDSVPPTDDFSLIYDTIASLVNIEIVRRIKGLSFDHVVLSGRTFLYKPFYNEIIEVLTNLFPGITIAYDENDAKKGCLRGPLTPIDISSSTNIVGLPKVVDLSTLDMKDVDNETIKERLKSKNVRASINEKINILKTWWDNIAISGGWMDDDKESETSTQVTTQLETESQKSMPANNMEQIMTTGVKINNFGDNTRIFISGNSYAPINGYNIKKGIDYNIYFDGEEFYLRTEEDCCLLRHDATNSDNNRLLFESLFPYSIQMLGENVDIPYSKPLRQR